MNDTPMPAIVSDEEWQAARIEGRWVPTSMPAAEWAARKLNDAENELDEIKAEITSYVETVKEWAQDRLRTGRAADLAESKRILETALKTYALDVRARSPRGKDGEPTVKTVKLPTATLETRKGADAKVVFSIDDMDAVVAWAEENAPDLVQKSVDAKALKLFVVVDGDGDEHIIDSDGTPVPGVTWEHVDAKEPGVTIRLHQRERF